MFVFLKSVFSETGDGSYSRVIGGLIVLATIGWVSYVVFKSHAIPDLSGPTTFITVSSGAHYVTNKITATISDIKGNQPPQQ